MNILTICYLKFLILFVVFSYAFIDMNLQPLAGAFTGIYTQHRVFTSGAFTLFIFLFFFFYKIILSHIKKSKTKEKIFYRYLLISSLILVFAYPAIVSYDIFNYMTTAKVLFFYQENPYIVMPIEFLNEPFLVFTRAANKLALYGPVWITLSGIPYLLGFNNFLLTLLNFKLFIALFYFASVYVLWKKTNNPFAVGVFALNPLVLFETFIGGHNDIVMMFWILLSFHALQKNRIIIGFIFLILSILIKFATLALLPLYIWFIWKKVKKVSVSWETLYFWSWILMFFIFLFSFIREEIYPWYAVWFLTFIPFLRKKTFVVLFSAFLSFVLLLRYIPFMASGSYFGTTPLIREGITIVPVILFLFIFWLKPQWLKKVFRLF